LSLGDAYPACCIWSNTDMNISFVETTANCPIAVVDNFFTELELYSIKEELKSLYEISKLKIYTNENSAVDENGNIVQKSHSLFVDELFIKNRSLSKILTTNKKIFLENELKKTLLAKNLFFSHIYSSTRDSTLVNFYLPTGYYQAHKDETCYTALSFFSLEPFSGGALVFPEYNIKIAPYDNRMVIFPGFLIHMAEEVKSGIRVSMAQFIGYKE